MNTQRTVELTGTERLELIDQLKGTFGWGGVPTEHRGGVVTITHKLQNDDSVVLDLDEHTRLVNFVMGRIAIEPENILLESIRQKLI